MNEVLVKMRLGSSKNHLKSSDFIDLLFHVDFSLARLSKNWPFPHGVTSHPPILTDLKMVFKAHNQPSVPFLEKSHIL